MTCVLAIILYYKLISNYSNLHTFYTFLFTCNTQIHRMFFRNNTIPPLLKQERARILVAFSGLQQKKLLNKINMKLYCS